MSKRAEKLPLELVKSQQSQSLLGAFSAAFFQPVMCSDAYEHAKMIALTADVLPYYSSDEQNCEADEEKKYLVLKGMYIFVWQSENDKTSWMKNGALLKLLQEHMELSNLSKLSRQDIDACYLELNRFCKWVYGNQKKHEKFCLLYKAFPADMQVCIRKQLNAGKDEGEWNEKEVVSHCGIGLIPNLGFNYFK
ncbi:hypothetical protein [Legionella spiritensis]|uniref:hypothetical protein n=1 Tax=Legionella spiritensis TaxID=452 RepID=UPI000F8397BB|nr:hypothetical protein [Legionella spiritensis]